MKNKKLKAFTMAEAILVMTILGIIAAIMLSTLKPSKWKEKGYEVLAKKILYEIDSATVQILTDHSKYGVMANLYNGATQFHSSDSANTWKLYKKYLVTTRATLSSFCTGYSGAMLKDGACMAVMGASASTNVDTIFPGETSNTPVKSAFGYIRYDINGNDEPNVFGKDRFVIPLGNEGIKFD